MSVRHFFSEQCWPKLWIMCLLTLSHILNKNIVSCFGGLLVMMVNYLPVNLSGIFQSIWFIMFSVFSVWV